MSRESEALHTETMQRLLAAFLPAGSAYRWGDGEQAISGVFLEAKDTLCIDGYRRTWVDGELKQVRRRITIRVEVEETELPDFVP